MTACVVASPQTGVAVPLAVSFAIAKQSIRKVEHPDEKVVTVAAEVDSVAAKRKRGNGRRGRKYNRVSSVLQSRMLKTKLCRWMLQGHCEKGQDCSFAHSEAELRTCPDFTRTRMCASFEQRGLCGAGEKCRFAHAEHELRGAEEYQHNALCRDWFQENCKSIKGCQDEGAGPREQTELDVNAALPSTQASSASVAEASECEQSARIGILCSYGDSTFFRDCSRTSSTSWDSDPDANISALDSTSLTSRAQGWEYRTWWAMTKLNAMIGDIERKLNTATESGAFYLPTPLEVCLFDILACCVRGSLDLSDTDMNCLSSHCP